MALSGHCTITAKLRRFSSCDAEDSVCTEYECDDKLFRDYFNVKFYANGSCPENEGHVSIMFSGVRPLYNFFNRSLTFSCVASVIDASGDKRFPKSHALYTEGGIASIFEKINFDRYLQRSTLLSDSSELLPDDCLTLCLEIDYEITDHETGTQTPPNFPRFGLHKGEDSCSLDMNTELGRYLCSVSSVFQTMMECPMVEKETGRVSFPLEEAEDLFLIYTFLTGSNLQANLLDICKLYRFAHKYDMQQIIQLCHQLLISLMRAMNTQKMLDYVDKDIHTLFELAELFEDDKILREILQIYSDIKEKIEEGTRRSGAYNVVRLDTEWICGKEGNEFVFRKVKSESPLKDSFR